MEKILLLAVGLAGGYFLFSKKAPAIAPDDGKQDKEDHGTLIEVTWADRAFESGYFSNDSLKDEIMFLGGLVMKPVSKTGNTEVYDAGNVDKLALDAITTALKIIPGAIISVRVIS